MQISLGSLLPDGKNSDLLQGIIQKFQLMGNRVVARLSCFGLLLTVYAGPSWRLEARQLALVCVLVMRSSKSRRRRRCRWPTNRRSTLSTVTTTRYLWPSKGMTFRLISGVWIKWTICPPPEHQDTKSHLCNSCRSEQIFKGGASGPVGSGLLTNVITIMWEISLDQSVIGISAEKCCNKLIWKWF